MNEKKVYFIRHNWNERNRIKLIDNLFSNKEIAIHYGNKGLDESSYQGKAKSALWTMKEAAKQDCIIVASYINHDHILIGKPNGKPVRKENRFNDNHSEELELKILSLDNVHEIQFDDLPMLFVIQPPYSTIVNWKMGESAINRFYNDLLAGVKSKSLGLNLLSGWQCEILCEEWMRQNNIFKVKLFHTGKSLKYFDIIGLSNNGIRVYAQVKFRGTKNQFVNFNNYLNNNKFKSCNSYYFDTQSNIDSFSVINTAGINLVSLESVFDDMKRLNVSYLRALTYG